MRAHVVRTLGVLGQFRRTCGRMNVLCGAVAIGREDLLPLGQGSGAEFAIGARARACQRDECVLWRPPDIWSSEPYDLQHRSSEVGEFFIATHRRRKPMRIPSKNWSRSWREKRPLCPRTSRRGRMARRPYVVAITEYSSSKCRRTHFGEQGGAAPSVDAPWVPEKGPEYNNWDLLSACIYLYH